MYVENMSRTVYREPTTQGNQDFFCQNTGNLVCSSSKFPDSKDKGYCNICSENFIFLRSCQVSFVYVKVTNHINWHRANLQSDREKQGKHKEFDNAI